MVEMDDFSGEARMAAGTVLPPLGSKYMVLYWILSATGLLLSLLSLF